jgi:hypothetical protein
VRPNLLSLVLALVAACSPLMAQTTPSATDLPLPQTTVSPKANAVAQYRNRAKLLSPKPFSVIAVGGGVSVEGINMQVAVNANRFINLRGTGNYFNYTASNISVSNFGLNAKLAFATGGASVDFYPFYSHGFRLSPGVLFYNQNQITASAVGTSGSSISLNNTKYYSETANPLALNGALGLNTRKQAFTATTGWGNLIPRYGGGHWSFPFEIGAAFTGVPSINVALTGFACTSQADAATSGPSCVNMATNQTAQTNLTTQVNKWKSDLNALQVYPILSFGVGYNFHIRH